MDLRGAGVVVTGGGSGSGAALARRLAAAGSRVVVNDLDAEGGPELPDQARENTWQVNVMAHVRAARELLPGWLARGHGRFLATVSAAALGTNLGAAPYAVSKHAALAFAEWLAATYGHRGITVQALCPQGVRTPMYENNLPPGLAVVPGPVLEQDDVADQATDALVDGRFLILPHPEAVTYAQRRATDPDRWPRQLGTAQHRLDEAIAALSRADHAGEPETCPHRPVQPGGSPARGGRS